MKLINEWLEISMKITVIAPILFVIIEFCVHLSGKIILTQMQLIFYLLISPVLWFFISMLIAPAIPCTLFFWGIPKKTLKNFI